MYCDVSICLGTHSLDLKIFNKDNKVVVYGSITSVSP